MQPASQQEVQAEAEEEKTRTGVVPLDNKTQLLNSDDSGRRCDLWTPHLAADIRPAPPAEPRLHDGRPAGVELTSL